MKKINLKKLLLLLLVIIIFSILRDWDNFKLGLIGR